MERQNSTKDTSCLMLTEDTEVKKTVSLPTVAVNEGQPEEPAGRARSLQDVHIKTLEEIKLEKALRVQQSSENSGNSPPQAEAALGSKRLLRITKTAGAKEEKKLELEDSGDAPSQSSVTKMEANETSDETISDPTKLPVNRCDTVKEKRIETAGERNVTNGETSLVICAGGDEASYCMPVVEKLVLQHHSAPGKTSPHGVIPERKAETSGIGDSILNVKCAAQTLEKRITHLTQSKCEAICGQGCLSSQTGSQTQGCGGALCPYRSCEAAQLSSVRQEGPTKKAAVAVVPLLSEDKSVAMSETEKLKDSSVLSSAQVSSEPLLPEGSGSFSSQMATKPRRLSSASTGKPPLSVEDDFEKLIWEISGGKLEAEIDLDPGKDEGGLLLELS